MDRSTQGQMHSEWGFIGAGAPLAHREFDLGFNSLEFLLLLDGYYPIAPFLNASILPIMACRVVSPKAPTKPGPKVAVAGGEEP